MEKETTAVTTAISDISMPDINLLDLDEINNLPASIADSVKTVDCYRTETYSGGVRPYYYVGTTEKVVISVPSDYEIFAIDFSTNFPAQVSIQKDSNKKFLWIIHLINLHGRHRPTGTFNIKAFAQQIGS